MIPSALDEILAALTVEIEAFAVCEISAESEIVIPPLDTIEVHYVLAGTLHLFVEGADPVALPPGSMVVAPPGRAQRMAACSAPIRSLSPSLIRHSRYDDLHLFDAADGKPGATRIMCGQISADVSGFFGPFDHMAGPIAADLGKVPMVVAAFGTMLREANCPGIYSKSLTASLMKACLILLIRDHVSTSGTHMLPGLFHKPWLSKAISAILEAPAATHSVASLAAQTGRGRSTFAKEFSENIGLAPMEFVTQARLAKACELLTRTGKPVSSVAAQVGYASRSHFSTAFRGAFGLDPSAYRRAHGFTDTSNVH